MPLDLLITAVLTLINKSGTPEAAAISIARLMDENGITVAQVVAHTKELPGPNLPEDKPNG